MNYLTQKRALPVIVLGVLALFVTVLIASATPPSDFMEQGSVGGDRNVRDNNDSVNPPFDWANSGDGTPTNTCPAPATVFTTVNLSGDGGLFNCGQVGPNNTTVPIAPVPTTDGTVGANFIDASVFVVDPLNTDQNTCGVPQTIDGDPTTYTGAGGEKNGDLLVVGANGVETWGGPNNTTPKNDISNVYAVSRTGFTRVPATPGPGPEKELWFGGERVINNGDSHYDFEFLQAPVSLSPASPPTACQGKFDGHRTAGDFIASIDYTNGGTLGTFSLAIWHCNADTHSADNSTGWVTNGAANPTSLNGKLCDVGSGALCVGASTPTTLADGSKACGTGPHYQVVGCTDADATDNVNCPPISGVVTAGDGVQAVTNTTAVPCGGWVCRDNNGNSVPNLDPNKFMEGGINLKSLGFTGCVSTFLPHTRTSASFTASIKDFTIIPFNTCTGAIRIVKQDASSPTPNLLPGACFSIAPISKEVCDNQASGTNVPGSDPARNTTVGDDDPDVGEICIDGLASGTYTVTETVVPAGYVGPASGGSATVPSPLTTNVECPAGPTGTAIVTFTNTLGSLAWEKRSDIDGSLQAGATFTVDGADANASGANTGEDGPFACHTTTDVDPITVVDNSAPDADPDDGQLLLNDVCVGTYVVTETASPAGFAIDPDATRTVTVSAADPNAVIGITGTADDCPDADDATDTDEADFCNVVGSLFWEKRAKDRSAGEASPVLIAGASFSVEYDTTTRTVDDCIVAPCTGEDVDADGGQFCIGSVPLGTLVTVTETAAPENYAPPTSPDDVKTTTLTVSSTCDGTPTDLGDFLNTPLSEIEVIFRSLAGDGVTQLETPIVCEDATPTDVPDTDADSDGSDPDHPYDDAALDRDEVFTALVPGTYVCTIVVDP